MSAPNLPNDPSALREELQDRLADLALSEVLGGRKPRELPHVTIAQRPGMTWRNIAKLSLAASLLIATGAVVGTFVVVSRQHKQSAEAILAGRDLQAARTRAIQTTRDFGEALADDAKTFNASLPSEARHVSGRDLKDRDHGPGVTVGLDRSDSFASDLDVPFRSDDLPLTVPQIGGYVPSRSNAVAGPSAELGDRSGGGKTQAGESEHFNESDGLPNTWMMVKPRIIIQEEESLLINGERSDQGRGPGNAGDRYSRIVENPFLKAIENPLSTFSIDVDTASYAKARRYLLQNRVLPPPDAVRIEEFVNYFHYDYAPPKDDGKPFAAQVEVAACPWTPKHRLVRIGLKGREIEREARPASNLVFLLDVSGSMEPDDKLPRVRRSMKMLTEQLGENDRVAIVVYAGATGLALPSTPAYRKHEILEALDRLQSGGSTNGGAGIRLAYELALTHFIKGGTNRVILCTDGDFNVGTTSTGELERLVEEKAKTGVFLTVLGFGMGNHNDDMLEKLADKGNGNYGYIDTEEEARKLLVEELSGTLVTIAKDVKIQVEFDPRTVGAYRLLGYENRMLRAEDFNDDKKDAGEIGAGHTVTALYEIVPAGEKIDTPPVDPLRYQQVTQPADATASGELLTLKLRFKEPDGQESKAPLVFPVTDQVRQFGQASADFKFATAVAGFAMLLRDSQHRGNFTYDAVLEIAQEGRGEDRNGYRAAFIELVKQAKAIAGK